jgi:hypothetical protein
MPSPSAAVEPGVDPLGVGVLVGVLVAATCFGLWRRRTDGRVRVRRLTDGPGSQPLAAPAGPPPAAPAGPPPATPAGPPQAAPAGAGTAALHAVVGELGSRATLVQLSSAFCAPCRTARVVLADVAAGEPGVRHVEIDAESHLDLVRQLGITRTPTTLLLDAGGRELGRAHGVPRRDQLQSVLASITPPRTTG